MTPKSPRSVHPISNINYRTTDNWDNLSWYPKANLPNFLVIAANNLPPFQSLPTPIATQDSSPKCHPKISITQPVTLEKHTIATPLLSTSNSLNNNPLISQSLSLALSRQSQSSFDCQSATKSLTKYPIFASISLLFIRCSSSKSHYSTHFQTIPEWLWKTPLVNNKSPKSTVQSQIFPLNRNDAEHFFLLCPQWQTTSKTALHSAFCPAISAAITTMPANVPSPLPTDQLNCRFQQQQTTQMHSSIVYALSFSHSILSRLNSTPSTFTTAVADKSTQPQTTFALHFIPLHSSTKSTKPLRADVQLQLRFRNFS